MNIEDKIKLISYFKKFVTAERFSKIEKCAENRTNYITVVLEDIYQPHNISASLRSCEAFGLKDVYVIEEEKKYNICEGVVKGATDWLDIRRYGKQKEFNTQVCFQDLKKLGYRIVATSPAEKDTTIDQLSLDAGKIALIFGTEETGLSNYAMQHADEFVKIPMFGFTGSFNISVSVALCLYELTKRLRASDINWQLNPSEMIDLQLDWLRKNLKNSEILERHFNSSK